MRDSIGLAAVPTQQAASEPDTRAAQIARAMKRARSGPRPAGGEVLRSQHFLLNGQCVAFVDVDGTQETDVAEVAATLEAITHAQAVSR